SEVTASHEWSRSVSDEKATDDLAEAVHPVDEDVFRCGKSNREHKCRSEDPAVLEDETAGQWAVNDSTDDHASCIDVHSERLRELSSGKCEILKIPVRLHE